MGRGKAARRANQLPNPPDLQRAWLLLLLCASPRAEHAIRTMPPSASAAYARGHDNAIWTMPGLQFAETVAPAACACHTCAPAAVRGQLYLPLLESETGAASRKRRIYTLHLAGLPGRLAPPHQSRQVPETACMPLPHTLLRSWPHGGRGATQALHVPRTREGRPAEALGPGLRAGMPLGQPHRFSAVRTVALRAA